MKTTAFRLSIALQQSIKATFSHKVLFPHGIRAAACMCHLCAFPAICTNMHNTTHQKCLLTDEKKREGKKKEINSKKHLFPFPSYTHSDLSKR